MKKYNINLKEKEAPNIQYMTAEEAKVRISDLEAVMEETKEEVVRLTNVTIPDALVSGVVYDDPAPDAIGAEATYYYNLKALAKWAAETAARRKAAFKRYLKARSERDMIIGNGEVLKDLGYKVIHLTGDQLADDDSEIKPC